MAERQIEQEIIGYGPGTGFASILSETPIKPRSVKVFLELVSSVISASDDGAGKIFGPGITGTISYATGEIAIVSSTALLATKKVRVDYKFFAYGVTELNKVQYVQQDFTTMVGGLKNFLKENYPSQFNDFVTSSLGHGLIDIIAYAQQNLSWYLNRKVTDFYFPTARTPNSVSKIARTLGYKPSGASGSIVPVTITLKKGPYTFPVTLNKPFGFKGPNSLQFEFRGDVPVIFAPGELTKSVDLQEGETVVENFVSNGETNQVFRLLKVPAIKFVAEGSIVVKVASEAWAESPIIPFKNIKSFESNILSTPPTIKFGDGVQGQIPPAQAGIEVRYVIVSGFKGRINSETIREPVVPLTASFTEIPLTILQNTASAGGDDPEDLRSITVNAPIFQRTQDRAITKADYDFIANTFPNVARADAQIVRGVTTDTILLGYFSDLAQTVIDLRNADRFLSPRPQVQTLSFSGNLSEQMTASVAVDGFVVTQPFLTDTATTLAALADQIAARPKVASALVLEDATANVITVTALPSLTVVFTAFSVSLGTVASATVTQTAPPPNQVQVFALDADLFTGNVVAMNYAGIPVAVPFSISAEATLGSIASSIANFAIPPTAAIKEIQPAPKQLTEIKFNRNFYAGNKITVRLSDLSQSAVVETIINVGFTTDHSTTVAALATAIVGLGFVESVSTDAVARKITIATDSTTKVPEEIVGVGPGTTFSTTLAKLPLKPGLLKIAAEAAGGAINATDNGLGAITGSGPGGTCTGTINYETGALSLNYLSSIVSGKKLTASYWFFDSGKSILVSSAVVTNNNTTVDAALRTITIGTDGPNNLALTLPTVTPRAAPALILLQTQSMIAESLGSVAGLATGLEAGSNVLRDYLDETYTDGCRANTVQVSVLTKDLNRKYVTAPTTILDALKAYLEERKDAVHSVVCVSGIAKVIDVDVTVEVRVSVNAIEGDVTSKIENSLKKSDALPYGILVEREFNKSLYVSDIFDAIREELEDREFTYLNVLITGPRLHPSGLQAAQHFGVGTGGASQVLSGALPGLPVVPLNVTIKVGGISVAIDDGGGEFASVLGSPYLISGVIDYDSGALSFTLTPAPPLGVKVTLDAYASLIDRRGNLICPHGHVLQYGNIQTIKLARI